MRSNIQPPAYLNWPPKSRTWPVPTGWASIAINGVSIMDTWSVLAHLYPEADVPVVQLSLNALKPFEYHLQLGAKLDALRRQGILILSSGNVVHNLRRVDWANRDGGEAWAYRFDDAAAELMENRPSEVVSLVDHPDFASAVPTPDHFLPLLYTAGIAATSPSAAKALVRGYALGSLSMTCYGVGMDGFACEGV